MWAQEGFNLKELDSFITRDETDSIKYRIEEQNKLDNTLELKKSTIIESKEWQVKLNSELKLSWINILNNKDVKYEIYNSPVDVVLHTFVKGYKSKIHKIGFAQIKDKKYPLYKFKRDKWLITTADSLYIGIPDLKMVTEDRISELLDINFGRNKDKETNVEKVKEYDPSSIESNFILAEKEISDRTELKSLNWDEVSYIIGNEEYIFNQKKLQVSIRNLIRDELYPWSIDSILEGIYSWELFLDNLKNSPQQ